MNELLLTMILGAACWEIGKRIGLKPYRKYNLTISKTEKFSYDEEHYLVTELLGIKIKKEAGGKFNV